MDCHSWKACPISGMVAGGFLSLSVLNIWSASLSDHRLYIEKIYGSKHVEPIIVLRHFRTNFS